MTTVKISATIQKETNDQLESLYNELQINSDLEPNRSQIVNMLLKKGILAYRQEQSRKK